MKLKRIIGSVVAVVALAAAGTLYAANSAKSSDHQDTYNLANSVGHNPSADITDVFVFPAPDDTANKVVLAVDVWPLIPAGMGPSKFFDPTIMTQIKIAHGATSPEDQVIQFGVTGTDASQRITMYGPGRPNEVGTTNTFLSTPTGTVVYNNTGNFQNNSIQFYAGPRADPFVFDLFAFFTFLGDRNYAVHTSQDDPATAPGNNFFNGDTVPPTNTLAPPYDQAANPKTPSFNGFNGQLSGTANGNYACSTNPASNSLANFNVLTFIVELPKSMLEPGGASHTIHVWATTNSSTTTS